MKLTKQTLMKHWNYLWLVVPYALILGLSTAGILNKYLLQICMLGGVNIIMTVSLNLVNGVTGQFSIGHAGFMAVGAYVSAALTTGVYKLAAMGFLQKQLVFVVAMLVGGLVAALFGWIIAQPTMKVKGDYLAIVTLGFGEVIRSLIRITDYVGGPRGMSGISKMSSFTWIYLLVLVAVLGVRNFTDSRYGRGCLAVRENEIAAGAMGVNTKRYKTTAFTFAAFLAGIAGCLYAHLYMYIQPDSFAYSKSTDFLVYLYAGGVGTISGSIVGAFFLTLLPEMLRFLADWRLVIYALLLLYMIIFRPHGLMGGREFKCLHIRSFALGSSTMFEKLRAKLRRKKKEETPV